MNELEEGQPSAAEKAVEKALDVLREHYDACSILLNRVDEDGNHVFNHNGFGNRDTRYGSMRRWLIHEEESIREQTRMDIREEHGE